MEYKGRYKVIYEGLSADRMVHNYVFGGVVEHIQRNSILSDATLKILVSTIRGGLSKHQKLFLREGLKGDNENKVKVRCKYVSLFADEVPQPASVLTPIQLIKELEEGSLDHFIGKSRRLGAAHALMALESSHEATKLNHHHQPDRFYPEVIKLFTKNQKNVLDLHRFIKERGLDIGVESDLKVLREYTEAFTPLAAGRL